MPRNARAEAREVVGPQFEPAVLEPSPPAVGIGPHFADDPVAVHGGRLTTLSPTGAPGTVSWNQFVETRPDLANWVSRRWLGGTRRLPPVPDSLVTTRLALHRLAAYVIAPARHAANGKFGLRWTLDGFGTPFFGEDRQIRVAGNMLIDQRGASVAEVEMTSLAAAANFLGTDIDPDTAAEHDSPPVGDVDEVLDIDPAAADFLGQWYGMAFAALEALRADSDTVDPSRPQLWPGHFDPAIEAGDENHRASYGASPGDQSIEEPYLYVSAWWPDRLDLDTSDPFWNAPGFAGRVLRAADFDGEDHVEVALQFWSATRDALDATAVSNP